MKKLLLVDGNALMHRAYHAIPPLTTTRGEQVNAIFGFTSLFLRSLDDLKPSHVIFTFDMSGPTFRHKMDDNYKATRQKMDEDLANQIPRLKQLVKAFGLPIYELEGFEADDLIGTLAREATDQTKDVSTFIMTADMDASQLVNDRVSIYTAKQKISETIVYDADGIVQKYNGLRPDQIVDYKALRGDTSDNIPGVPGIGEKTATDLLIQYQTLDGIYEHLNELKDRTKMLLEQGRESAKLSKQLATIDTHVPIELKLEECALTQFDTTTVKQLFQELEFRTLVNKLPDNGQPSSTAEQSEMFAKASAVKAQTKATLVKDKAELDKLVKDLKKQPVLAFDTEGTSLDVWSGRMIGVSLSHQAGTGYYIPWADWSEAPLKDLLEDDKIDKVAHHAKFDIQMLHRSGISITSVTFDTMIAAFLVKGGMGKFGLKELAFNDLGIEATPITELIGTGAKQLTLDQVDINQVAVYAAADADHTWQLYQIYKKQLEEQPQIKKLFDDIEMPVALVLAQMEELGVNLDVKFLNEMSKRLAGQLAELEKGIYDNVGHQFNLNSPMQLATVLFDELNLPFNKKTKTGRSTDESVLQGLKDAHPVVKQILEYRELYKLKSTYVDALPSLISSDGRLHTSYHQAVAATGRLSSQNPNLQNIPIRTEEGRKIRQAFLANPGQILASIDYSQIELRLLAHISKDPALLDAFAQGQDVHTATAAKVFNCSIEEVTKDQRRAAKTINFGLMYGQSAHGLSMQLGIPRDQAAQFIEDYFIQFVGVKEYLKQALVEAHKNGYVETLFGRRRSIPDLRASNFMVRSGAERMAINMPIQGTAADVIKRAMIDIQHYLNDQKSKSQMLLQVHDELVFSIEPSEQDQLLPVLMKKMSDAGNFSVKLEVEAKLGPNWGEMEELRVA